MKTTAEMISDFSRKTSEIEQKWYGSRQETWNEFMERLDNLLKEWHEENLILKQKREEWYNCHPELKEEFLNRLKLKGIML